ncbi:SlyX family protein [Bradyrhizobium sp. 31Argb]|uniref:SlyX family protein n=1 Tax=unclassified Bradyrhizobium TaxID=2631580 RepID=UPI00102E82E7|nr:MULTISPECIES: SlyX family protein [unclassified Bradyrhizobium]MDI4235958.1 SlyX family protein [Bradyrhizobium sp. Arg237L]TAI67786.1 SlyX protein [Bradyrhizobium sp. Leo170]
MTDAKTTDMKTLAERIDALETRIAYQDDTIETLNETITAQWKQIDALTRQVAELREQLQEAESNTAAPINERPPHY